MSGGCFQNKYLLEKSIEKLRETGFKPYWHQRIPTNDGGLSAGQLAALVYELKEDCEIQILGNEN